MHKKPLALALVAAMPLLAGAQDAPAKALGVVTVTGGQPTSMPTQIPTTFDASFAPTNVKMHLLNALGS